MKTKILRKENAITLVALIITIIVLLILAMVSIALVMNSGIITKSKTAVDKYSQEEIQEQIKLAYAEWQTAQWTSDAGDAATFMQTRLRTALNDNGLTVTGSFKITLSNGKEYFYNAKTGQMAGSEVDLYPEATPGKVNNNENTKYTSDGKTAVIPKGYAVSNVEAEQSINTGLVIKEVVDNNNDGIDDDATAKRNEWVWIPVANVTDLYTENTTNQEWILCGTSGDNKVVSQYASKARTEIRSDLTRVNPGDTSGYREPDTVVGDGSKFDAVQENRTAAGFTTLVDMATKLKDDYKNMIDSVRKNGGFYVGRYELSEAGTKKDQPALVSTTWYNLYAKCKTLGDESTTYSRMIWGCQWDQVCKFISTSGDKVSLTNSRTYGNYYDSQAPANTGNYEKSGRYAVKKNTGSNEAWKTNNIYDLAGNCTEWTQEADVTVARAVCGGSCSYGGNSCPVTYRSFGIPTDPGSGNSSRPVLYLK